MRLGTLTVEKLSQYEQDLAEEILDFADDVVSEIKANGGSVQGAGFSADEDDDLIYTLVAEWIGTDGAVSADLDIGETSVVVWLEKAGTEYDAADFSVAVLPGLVRTPTAAPTP